MSQELAITLNGRYKLLERIGSGGMSVVYKAQDLSLGRIVAVKMLHDSLTGDENFLRRFHQEAYAAANLTHPNIVTVHDIGQDGDQNYIIMEYVDGQTLKQIIRAQHEENGRFLPIARVLELAIQICKGIGYAHRANLVHCDVKPQNVLVTRDDRVKVADFGIARAISEASRQQDSQVWGTPQYFAPEQAAGEPATPASDVYAIGIILFEMLTGRLPFEADTYTAIALKHLHEPPPPVTQFNPAVPPQLARIVDKVLAKQPANRYRTAGQLGRILSSYRQSSQAETGPVYPVDDPTQETGVPIGEQRTQLFQRPMSPIQSPATHVDPGLQETPARPRQPVTTRHQAEGATSFASSLPEGTDWLAIGLGVTALIALLGLIPLWYLVYRAWIGG